MMPPTEAPKPKRSWYTTLAILAMAIAVVTLIPAVLPFLLSEVVPILFSSGGILIASAVGLAGYPIYKAIKGNEEQITTTRHYPSESYSAPMRGHQPSPDAELERTEAISSNKHRRQVEQRRVETRAQSDDRHRSP
jgi:hypothetical protein